MGQGLHYALLLLELLLLLIALLVVRLDLRLHGSQHPLPALQCLLQLQELLFEALAATQLPLRLSPLGVEHVLQVTDLHLALQLIILMRLYSVGEADVVIGHLLHLSLELVPRPQEFVPLANEAIDGVLLVHAKTCTLLHEVTEVCNLYLEVVDGLLCSLLLFVGGLHHLPSPLDLLLQVLDRGLVLLGEAQSSLNLRSIGHDLCIQLPAFLDEALLALVRLLQGPVKLLILEAEVLKRLVANELLQDLLEVLLQRLEGAGLEGVRVSLLVHCY
mmetsp:Transcript_7245/g.15802  ORF Transcript_7245/g.15802 Transcript_7245/m.15802 type:complete len:274 (-) Transcript_7245:39-860(-)